MRNLGLLWLLLCMFLGLGLHAQEVGMDSVPYKIGTYDIKKQIKVTAVAAKLSVNPQIIVKLNKLRNVNQDLVPGQRIKIPVYPKGYKYTPETVVVHKTPELDSAAIKLLYGEEAKKTEEPVILPALTTEEATNRLALVDVMMEMNEAMLQGIQASIDTLNIPESDKPVDEKNIQALLQKMKRARDKVLLMPYLEHIQDSLTQEMVQLKNERVILNKILAPESVAKAQNDSVTAVLDTSVVAQLTPEDTVSEETKQMEALAIKDDVAKDDNKKIEVKRNEKRKNKFKEYFPMDTVIIYDLGPTISSAKTKTAVNQNPETDVNQKRKGKWDTARAENPIIDSLSLAHLQKPLVVPADTGMVMKIQIPNTHDSVVIKSIKVQKAPKDTVASKPVNVFVDSTAGNKDSSSHVMVLTDTVANKDTVTNPLAQQALDTATVDTQAVTPVISQMDTVTKPVVKKPTQSVGDMALAAADSIKHIKAEFFYRRAQKAIGEKNFRNAEQYLKKAVELYPRHFNAWFAMAEMDDLFGSQGLALKEYKICASIDSTQPKLFYNMGSLYQKMKRKSEAYKEYEKALSLNPEYVLALMAQAEILTDWKQYDAATYNYDKVINLNRTYHYAYKARGQVKLMNREFASAIDDFTRFLIFEETDPSAYYYRGLAKIGNNELMEGCLDLSKAADMGYVAAQKAIKKTCE